MSSLTPLSRLYRYFDTEEYAERFVQGMVWLTTFEACRRYEDSYRGDPDEGSRVRVSRLIAGHGDDPRFRARAAESGVSVHPAARDIIISQNRTTQLVPNAWLLCASQHDDPEALKEFGRFCVKILQPIQFAEKVAASIGLEIRLQGAHAGPVIYRSNEYRSSEPAPERMGFTKDPSYALQNEFRLIWHPAGNPPISPREFICAASRSHLKRIR